MALADALYLWKFSWLPFGKSSEYTPAELREPRTVDHLLGACMLIRRDVWEALDGMDENYFLFLEETDWCLRAKIAGWQIVYYPEARVTHFGQASMRQEPSRSIPQFYKSYLYFYRAHHDAHSAGTLMLKLIIAVACLIRIGMWRERAARASDTGTREVARGMTIGYRQALSELGTF
jgi:GT2 family glycosyltransferase